MVRGCGANPGARRDRPDRPTYALFASRTGGSAGVAVFIDGPRMTATDARPTHKLGNVAFAWPGMTPLLQARSCPGPETETR